MKIHELNAHLINKIAAGEVIERPASIVKELVENAIDAGASQIEVIIESGGTGRICVIDDGVGMSPVEVALAIKRHTTSKITHEDDLYAIKTLGFRGEALASIVEVSRTVISSKSSDSPEGAEIEIEGGIVKAEKATGRRQGTSIDVRDLFFNTPARRKFLKSDKTEYTHILRTVKRFALSYPKLHFKLMHGVKTALDSPPSQNLRDVIAHLYSNELAKSLLEVRAEGNAIQISGLIAPPQTSRTDRMEQHITVNGRVIRDLSLNYAIGRAYEGFIESGRFPITFLTISIDPEMIDVNVHPKKEEVRFSNPSLVQSELKRAVSNALLSHGVIPSLRQPTSKGVGSFDKKSNDASLESSHGNSLSQIQSTRGQLDLRSEWVERARANTAQSHVGSDSAAERAGGVQDSQSHHRIIGQLHGTYILVQTSEGIEMIDQHVAHERILYEKFLKQLSTGRLIRQRLLIPMTLKFSADEGDVLDRHIEVLDGKLGIGIEPFGNGTFILRDWPECLSKNLTPERVTETLMRLLDTLENESEVEVPALAKELAADLACKAAVVKNTPLTREEMETLVLQLKDLENPYRCPHGRPIVVTYSLGDLERAFGRR